MGLVSLMHHLEQAAALVMVGALVLAGMTTEGVKDGLTIAVGITVLLGILWRIVIVPNLRKEFGEPIARTHALAEETNRQVSRNGHSDPAKPTLPDLFADVLDRLDRMEQQQSRLEQQQTESVGEHRLLVSQVDQHLGWSNDIVARLTAEIARKADKPEESP